MKDLPIDLSDVNYLALLGYGVIGNTAGFDPVILGSSPSSPRLCFIALYGRQKSLHFVDVFVSASLIML